MFWEWGLLGFYNHSASQDIPRVRLCSISISCLKRLLTVGRVSLKAAKWDMLPKKSKNPTTWCTQMPEHRIRQEKLFFWRIYIKNAIKDRQGFAPKIAYEIWWIPASFCIPLNLDSCWFYSGSGSEGDSSFDFIGTRRHVCHPVCQLGASGASAFFSSTTLPFSALGQDDIDLRGTDPLILEQHEATCVIRYHPVFQLGAPAVARAFSPSVWPVQTWKHKRHNGITLSTCAYSISSDDFWWVLHFLKSDNPAAKPVFQLTNRQVKRSRCSTCNWSFTVDVFTPRSWKNVTVLRSSRRPGFFCVAVLRQAFWNRWFRHRDVRVRFRIRRCLDNHRHHPIRPLCKWPLAWQCHQALSSQMDWHFQLDNLWRNRVSVPCSTPWLHHQVQKFWLHWWGTYGRCCCAFRWRSTNFPRTRRNHHWLRFGFWVNYARPRRNRLYHTRLGPHWDVDILRLGRHQRLHRKWLRLTEVIIISAHSLTATRLSNSRGFEPTGTNYIILIPLDFIVGHVLRMRAPWIL